MTTSEQVRPPRFEGRVAVITGAGSGMGAAMARGFHAEGVSDRARPVVLDGGWTLS